MNLQMTVAAVKAGTPREKDGRKYCMNTATFLTPDGDSFKLDYNAYAIQLRVGDTAVFGVRSYTNEKGYTNVSLYVASACPVNSTPAK